MATRAVAPFLRLSRFSFPLLGGKPGLLLWRLWKLVRAEGGGGQTGGVVEVGFDRGGHESITHRCGLLYLRTGNLH